jgi:prepilin-type processing-associated H-X9-DG protein
MRQIGLATRMYIDENEGYLLPRTHPNRWPSRLQRYFVNPKVMLCPTDGIDPATGSADTNTYPFDAAPRSYIYNAWNDFYSASLNGVSNWRQIVATNGLAMKEIMVMEPSATITFGEKFHTNTHWYFDYETIEDVYVLDQNRHSARTKQANNDTVDGKGGSNYAFVDGSVRYLGYQQSFTPLNMWMVTPWWRTNDAAVP